MQDAQPTTGIAASAARLRRQVSVLFLRAMQIIPGSTLAQSWKCGLLSNMSVDPVLATSSIVAVSGRRDHSWLSTKLLTTTSPMRDTWL